MAAKYKNTAEQKAEIEQARRKNKDKREENKLKALSMRGDGASARKIGEVTGYHPAYVSTLVSKYIHGGLEAITGNHYGGNRRNMSFEEEQEFLKPYIERAARGYMLDTAEIGGTPQILLVSKGYPSIGFLSSHPGISLCLWGCRANHRGELLPGHAIL